MSETTTTDVVGLALVVLLPLLGVAIAVLLIRAWRYATPPQHKEEEDQA